MERAREACNEAGVGFGRLRVEYAERPPKYGTLFIHSLFYEYINLEYVRMHAMFRVNQAGYGIHIVVAAPRENANTYLTRRLGRLGRVQDKD